MTKDIPSLRTAGLSQRKAEYISGLAEKFSSGELSAQMLVSASDPELIDKLVAVRGLGRWSVEMFACFGLKRMDVFSTGDLGVQYVDRSLLLFCFVFCLFHVFSHHRPHSYICQYLLFRFAHSQTVDFATQNARQTLLACRA